MYLLIARSLMVQSNAIKGRKFILGFLEIFSINGTFYNGNIGVNIHFILEFQKIFPFNGVPINGIQLYFLPEKVSDIT